MTPEKLGELETLLKAGTPGPWDRRPNGDGDAAIWCQHYAIGTIYQDSPSRNKRRNNAALIVAAINALPELVAMARRVAELEALLEQADVIAETLQENIAESGDDTGSLGIVMGFRLLLAAALQTKGPTT